ncbi:tyrosine-type recombinase/integrase [Pseudobacteroides cellulosolvens]|uniref:tyrosine-type recombinase/integrase n=1 Tax=Pseudobacteroides cellulosolvens TaxID=35825 RepID=UPI001FA6AF3C|nr:tyrosine-type recombinase/integrase [Pseudobacteroides cellulosolvens]
MKGSGILPTIEITDLIAEATKTLYDLEYSPRVIEYTVATWKQFENYCLHMQISYYSSAMSEAFCNDLNSPNPLFKHKTILRKISCMKKFDAFAKTRGFKKGIVKQKEPLPENFTAFLTAQDEMFIKKAYSESTRETAYKFCNRFMAFLLSMGLDKLSGVTWELVSKYLLTLNGHAKSTVRGELSRLRQTLKYMYLLQYNSKDFSKEVPSYNLGQANSMSKIWESKELDQVLQTIDKSSTKGKRDTAFILIASELGVRSADIRNLKLTDINWESCSISFVQSKTGKPNVLPLSEKLGTAIIDYLRVRPETDSPYIFVSLIPPYGQMAKFNSSFHNYVHRAGIEVKREAHYGLHSLRATVATKLLAADVSPDVIVPFLGHSGNQTLHAYIRMDIENLRECALSFEDGALI